MLLKKPKQAVILAGGKGLRLRPLTKNIPKPMIRFSDKPFLEFLMKQIKNQGIEHVVLLSGYLGHIISDYFGDGHRFGISIKYSKTDVANDTGTRLRLARPMIDSAFLLMYCDNIWPMNLSLMWKAFVEKDVMAQITVYMNKDGFTKNNLRLDASNMVVEYDKQRKRDNLQGVEIGYAILKKEVLDLIPEENCNFEKTVFPKLIEHGKLAGFPTDHRYYSVSTLERLPLTEQFLAKIPAVILDRDGVLNKKPPKAHYVTKWEEFLWMPGAIDAIILLKKAGYRVIVVTNQAGIARGHMSSADLDDIHHKMQSNLERHNVSIDAIYHCPHGWDDGCECRKPKPGMLFQAQRDFHIDLTKTYFIGDDERDLEAGKRADCITRLVTDNLRLIDIVEQEILKV